MTKDGPIYIGVAWPYANGGLHLGHVAGSLLPPDIARRYHLMQERDVLMVSGSDCHGTPILLKAEQEGVTPQEIVERYHADHSRALDRLGIGFNTFTTTRTDNHRSTVHEIFRALQEEDLLVQRIQEAPYDTLGKRFLPDRYVEGTCPHCAFEDARGDQCDSCGRTLEPQELVNPRSKLNPESPIEFRETEHSFLRLDALQADLAAWIEGAKGPWRQNVVNFTENWLKEGLRERPITRDLTWGIPMPDGQEGKCIYVWFEAVIGYLSAAKEWASTTGSDWEHFWRNPETKAFYFLGKDNIPFHTIIWPAILIGYNRWLVKQGQQPLVLPYDVPANEFLNLDGQQFSKSRGVSIAVHDVLDKFPVDLVRYYLSINMPEQRDADWTWDDFLSKTNDELVGAIGNLAHRILSFTHKNVGHWPAAAPSAITAEVDAAIASAVADVEAHLEATQLKKAMRRILEFAGQGNQIMQAAAPWKVLKADPEAGQALLHDLLRIVQALCGLLHPYLPHATQKLWSFLGRTDAITWTSFQSAPAAETPLQLPQVLFQKLDPKEIQAMTTPEPEPETVQLETVDFETFTKVKLRIGKILSVEDHPKADKLYVVKVDGGDLGERQIVAGLKAYYTKEELEGQTIAFVANLAPVKLRGIESQGMLLAGDHGDVVSLLNPNRDLPAGAEIR